MIDYNPVTTEIQFVKGIGEYRGKLFNHLGLLTVNDLFEYFPRDYIHRYVDVQIRQLEIGQYVNMLVNVFSVHETPTKKGNKHLKAIVSDGDRFIECVWFTYGAWLSKLLKPGNQIWINGKVSEYYGNLIFQQPQIQEASAEDETTNSFWKERKILPIYRLTNKLTQNIIRNTVYNAFALYHKGIEETLPDFLVKKYSFFDRKIALQKMHFSSNPDEVIKIKSRFVYEEFLYLQLMIAKSAKYKGEAVKHKRHTNKNILNRLLLNSLPFALTNAQKRVISEIFEDMVSDKPMNKLLQGDVGAGKTIVTLFCILLAIENGYQVALIAPSEILAEQHYKTVTKYLQAITPPDELLNNDPQNIPSSGLETNDIDFKINVCLLKGGKSKQKSQNKQRIAKGEIHLVIGTHALIQKDVVFHNLSFVVVDEQHKFGVAQRAELSIRHGYPDLLYLSATPIPRSLAMTVFGEMSISSIDELPPARKPIKTLLVYPNKRHHLYEKLVVEIQKGRQVYIVCPLIEESEHIDLQDAETLYNGLKDSIFSEFRVALLHSKKKAAEKDLTMQEFSNGEIDVLVSTTVIEVGIDVPNATIMVIEHAERFGLAQLHQMRGRVGRGGEQSYCYLIAYSMGEMAKERLYTMVRTNDGFVIAEKDLELRGAGDVFGTAQSGLPEFKFANLVTDQAWLYTAKKDAFFIIDEDFELEDSKHYILKKNYEKLMRRKETLSGF